MSHLLTLFQILRVTVWLSLSIMVFSLYLEIMARSICSFFVQFLGLFDILVSFNFTSVRQIEYLYPSEEISSSFVSRRNRQILLNYTLSHVSTMANLAGLTRAEQLAYFKSVFEQAPGPGIVHPAHIPPKPTLFDEVKFAPALTEDFAYLARRFWQEPDNHLAAAWRNHPTRPYPRAENDSDADMHVLAHNVYEHLMSNPFLPQSREDAVTNYTAERLDKVYNGIRGLEGLNQNVLIRGENIQDERKWTVAKLKFELKARDLDDKGLKAELQERLWRYEVDLQVPVLRQSNLKNWGINRTMPILSPATSTTLSALDLYTSAIWLSPYNPTYWTSRAYDYYLRGFFDLAIGDAHRSDLLCEVLTTATQRNKRPGLYTRVWDAVQMHIMAGGKMKGDRNLPEIIRMRKANGINYFIPTLLNANYNIISLCLAAMNCWDDFEIYLAQHERRNLQFRDIDVPKKRKMVVDPIIAEMATRRARPTNNHPSRYGHEWMSGWVSGAPRYPYQQADVNRLDTEFLRALNANVFTIGDATMAPNSCEARPVTKKDGTPNGLGVFARRAIKAGALIHYEEPVLRGHLLPNLPDGDKTQLDADNPRCENCKSVINPAHMAHLIANWPYITGARPNPGGVNHALNCHCLSMLYADNEGARNDIVSPLYCHGNDTKGPGAKQCKDLAKELWAFGNRNIRWGWLHDCMRAPIEKWNGKDYFVAHHEKHGTYLSLLLKHVFELTLHRREHKPPTTEKTDFGAAAAPAGAIYDEDETNDPSLLAHEINELLMLETGTDAGEPWSESWFPFTMSGNIRVPFDILTALGVDIFHDFSFDTWVIQLVLRKLLINAVPWCPKRRGKGSMFRQHDGFKNVPFPHQQDNMRDNKITFSALKPSVTDLYLFPGLSLFNHSCRETENATWAYDTAVQNRVVVYATKDINADEEIRIPYQDLCLPGVIKAVEPQAVRLFGKNCNCDQCTETGDGSKSDSAAKSLLRNMEQTIASYKQASGSGSGAGTGGRAAGRVGAGAGKAFEAVFGSGAGGDKGGYVDGDGANDVPCGFRASKPVTIRPNVQNYARGDDGTLPSGNKRLEEAVKAVYQHFPEYQSKDTDESEAPWSDQSTEEDEDGDIVLDDA
jgi:hypothetical protein